MKAISIIQPFASLIMLPDTHKMHKRVENRNWPTRHRGLLAIHASKTRRYDGEHVEDIAESYGLPRGMTFGAVLGTVNLIDCLHIDELPTSGPLAWAQHHIHSSGPYCWILGGVRPFKTPVPCSGARGLWDWDSPTLFA